MTGPVDWDKNLLSPLFGVFGEECEHRPRGGEAYRLTGFLTGRTRSSLSARTEARNQTPRCPCWVCGMRNAA